jgi:hypothetical protein
VAAIVTLVEKGKIDCDFTLTRSFDVYTDKGEAETAKRHCDEFKEAGIAKNTMNDLVWTGAEHAEEVSASPSQCSYD